MKLTLEQLQKTYGFFSQDILDQMVGLFDVFKNTVPIKDNMQTIEYDRIIAEVSKAGEVDGLFYGSLACLGENIHKDMLHDYSRITYGDKIVHLVDFNKDFETFHCWATDLVDNSGLICLALQDLSPFKGFLIMHELGHVVRLMNGFPCNEAYNLCEIEEAIANGFAIKAYATYLNVTEKEIIDTYYKPLVEETKLKDATNCQPSMDMLIKHYDELETNTIIALNFLNRELVVSKVDKTNQLKSWEIPVSWESYGKVIVLAETKEDAMSIFKNNIDTYSLLKDSSRAESSFGLQTNKFGEPYDIIESVKTDPSVVITDRDITIDILGTRNANDELISQYGLSGNASGILRNEKCLDVLKRLGYSEIVIGILNDSETLYKVNMFVISKDPRNGNYYDFRHIEKIGLSSRS